MIEVGEYGRTNKGKIFIFSWVVDDKGQKVNYILKFVNGGPVKYYLEKGEEIVNHSKNIIDLIEEGDYVNGKKVISVLDGFAEGTMEIELSNHRKIYRTLPANIKTILTKELFEANCYKVKEE